VYVGRILVDCVARRVASVIPADAEQVSDRIECQGIG
jgi:hypothetical protein